MIVLLAVISCGADLDERGETPPAAPRFGQGAVPAAKSMRDTFGKSG